MRTFRKRSPAAFCVEGGRGTEVTAGSGPCRAGLAAGGARGTEGALAGLGEVWAVEGTWAIAVGGTQESPDWPWVSLPGDRRTGRGSATTRPGYLWPLRAALSSPLRPGSPASPSLCPLPGWGAAGASAGPRPLRSCSPCSLRSALPPPSPPLLLSSPPSLLPLGPASCRAACSLFDAPSVAVGPLGGGEKLPVGSGLPETWPCFTNTL